MSASLLPPGMQQFTDANGIPLAMGTVQFYIPGTTTPKDTWQDSGQVALNTNPVQLDGAGRAVIWGTGSYREIVKDAAANTIYDRITSGGVSSPVFAALNVKDYGAVGDGVTNDTIAVQAAIIAACALGSSKLYFPAGVYLVSNLTLPAFSGQTAAGWRVIEFVGEEQPSTVWGTIVSSSYFPSNKGSIIKSTATATGDLLAVLSNGGDFSGYHIVIRDLLFRTYDNPAITGVNMRWAQQLTMHNVFIDTGVWSRSATLPSTAAIYGFRPPQIQNGAQVLLRNVTVSGYYIGGEITEHTMGDYVNVVACKYAYEYAVANHASLLLRAGAYACQNNILVSGEHRGEILQLNIERETTTWQATINDVVDPSNHGHLKIGWSCVQGGTGQVYNFAISGGIFIEAYRLGDRRQPLAFFAINASADFPVPNNAATPIVWGSGSITECAVLNGGNTTQVLISEPGTYEFSFLASFAANATGYRQLQLFTGTTSLAIAQATPVSGVATPFHLFRATFSAAANDAISVKAFQNSGGPLNISFTPDSGTMVLKKLRSS